MVLVLKSSTTEVPQMIRAPKHTCPFMPSYVTEQSRLEEPPEWWEAAAHFPTSTRRLKTGLGAHRAHRGREDCGTEGAMGTAASWAGRHSLTQPKEHL